jgi:hypothetical protein
MDSKPNRNMAEQFQYEGSDSPFASDAGSSTSWHGTAESTLHYGSQACCQLLHHQTFSSAGRISQEHIFNLPLNTAMPPVPVC